MTYEWQLLLNHNTHFHYLDAFEGNNQSNLIFPTGCSEDETYWYEYVLTVTDPGGLSAVDSVEIFPDCEGQLTTGDLSEPLIIYPNPISGNRVNVLANIDLGSEVLYEIYSDNGSFIDGGTVVIYNQKKYFYIDLPFLADGGYTIKFKIAGAEYTTRLIKAKS